MDRSIEKIVDLLNKREMRRESYYERVEIIHNLHSSQFSPFVNIKNSDQTFTDAFYKKYLNTVYFSS